MFDFIANYPGFAFFLLSASWLLIKGIQASRKHHSWLPLLIYGGAVVILMLIGFAIGIAFTIFH